MKKKCLFSDSDSDCKPVPLDESETIGIIDIVLEPFGRCVNTEPIPEFAECSGSCQSKTTFNRIALKHDEKCTCCSISELKKVSVELKCEDGSSPTASVPVPVSCECGACSATSNDARTYHRNRDVEQFDDSAETVNRPNVNNALGWLFNAPRTFRFNLHRQT